MSLSLASHGLCLRADALTCKHIRTWQCMSYPARLCSIIYRSSSRNLRDLEQQLHEQQGQLAGHVLTRQMLEQQL